VERDWVHFVGRPLFGLLYQPRMIGDDESGAVSGMSGRGNQSTRRKPAPVLWPEPSTNPGRRSGMLATNRLSTIIFYGYLLLHYPEVFLCPVSEDLLYLYGFVDTLRQGTIGQNLLCILRTFPVFASRIRGTTVWNQNCISKTTESWVVSAVYFELFSPAVCREQNTGK
jgi:hypothetical protein